MDWRYGVYTVSLLSRTRHPWTHKRRPQGPDRETPILETLTAVNEMHSLNYFAKFGVSNYMSWEVAQIHEICAAKGLVKPTVYQGIYNAIHRSVRILRSVTRTLAGRAEVSSRSSSLACASTASPSMNSTRLAAGSSQDGTAQSTTRLNPALASTPRRCRAR